MTDRSSWPHNLWGISQWEFSEAVRRINDALRLPWGQRQTVLRSIAADYGVSVRTLYRWPSYKVHNVKVGKFHALYVIGKRGPSRVTPWEKVA